MSEFVDHVVVLALELFQPIVVEATVFIVCFSVSLTLIGLVYGVLTNPKQEGGE